MTDTAKLQLRVQSIEVELAQQRLDNLAKKGHKAERATDKLTGTFSRLVGPAAAVAASMGALNKVTTVTRQFDVLNAQLITATGSAENATKAFEAIQDFATQTPYDLAQATTGFTKLVNLGLTPSERAMRSYGDTASSMGKDLNQMVEAVADAATGEFERLKEFGIRSKKQGDQVSFTFRGVTQTVKFNAAEIEKYLIELGENNFAGAMAERMKTLDGALSNLQDEWNKTWLLISKQGVGNLIEQGVRTAIDGLAELNAQLASGQLPAQIGAIGQKFDGMGADIAYTLDVISGLIKDAAKNWGEDGDAAVNFIINAFKNWPENVRAYIKLVTVELAYLIDWFKVYDPAVDKAFGAVLVRMLEKAKAYGKAIALAANPFTAGKFDLDAELAKIDRITGGMIDDAFANAEKALEGNRAARIATIEAILKERDADVKAFEDRMNAATELRKEYDKLMEQRKKATGDRLEAFKVGGSGKSETAPTASPKDTKAFDSLQEELRTEEEAIAESYKRRLEIILKNTEEGSQKQADLKARLDKAFAEEALGNLQGPTTFDDQLAELEDYYSRRRDLILNNTSLTEEERTALETELTKARNAKLEELENARTSQILQNSSNMFGALADLSKTFAGEQSGVYKVMFAASKAFALADSIMKIQQGIANAAAMPWPANLGAIASTVAATAGVVSTISGTQYAGAFDKGGFIPAGKTGIVGEFGPELVNGPANVTSREDTMAMFKKASENTAAPVAPETNIRIINSIDPSVMEDYLGSDAGERVILNTLRRNRTTLKGMVA